MSDRVPRELRALRRLTTGCLFVGCLLAAGHAGAQAIDRPADERPSLDVPEAPERVPLELPAPPPPRPGADPLASGLLVFVAEVRVEGSTVFSDAELAEITEPFAGREIASSDLQDLTLAITRLYQSEGYLSSGATIPDQDLEGGVLVVRAVEARLVDVVLEGNRWHRSSYLKRRLLAAISTPVRMQDLEAQLQVLLQEPDIERVAGRLQPGPRPGEDVLELTLEERSPFGVRGIVANDNPPGIGELRGRLYAETRSATGFSDRLWTRFDFAEGLLAQEVRYGFPITPWETTLLARFRHTKSEIVRSPFDSADIEAETWTGGLGLNQPVVHTPSLRLDVGVLFERRKSQTWLSGSRFSFRPGPKNGRANVSVFRFSAEGSWRTPRNVLAVRSLLSTGFKIWNATDDDTAAKTDPDGRFVTWLGQLQWSHRLPDALLQSEFVFRGDVQLSDDPLLSLEQIAVGGVRTVRGYEENYAVRDNAWIVSGELRIPLLRSAWGDVRLATFFDAGHGWDDNRPEDLSRSDTLYSTGLGLLYDFSDRVSAYAYWAHPLKDQPSVVNNFQEDGFHLGIRVVAF